MDSVLGIVGRYTVFQDLYPWTRLFETVTAVYQQLQQYIEKGKRPKLSKANSEVIVFSEKLKIAGTVDLLRQLAIQSWLKYLLKKKAQHLEKSI